MTIMHALEFSVGLVAIGVGAILLALCLAFVFIILAAGRHAAREIEEGRR